MIQRRVLSQRASFSTKVLTVETMNQNIVEAEYAVRGELVLKSMEYNEQLKAGAKLPFDQIIPCNIGNPQALKQKPITFFRQVLSLVNFPELLDSPEVTNKYPADVVERATSILTGIPDNIGAYSESKGVAHLRQTVANFIEERDGHPADSNNIFLTDGASPAVQMLMRALVRNNSDGIMVPIPQYPLYSAACALFGGTMVEYYLDEDAQWAMPVSELARAVKEARANGTEVRALVVINPGNPTGNCMSRSNMEEVVAFCRDEKLMLLADEVYQENIWQDTKPFVSFKRVLKDMGSEYDSVELASFHSVSKGFLGECGRRGGYVELCGVDPGVVDQLYKLVSVSLCSNIEGQIMTSLMTDPPREGDPSYPLYAEERDGILESLKRRAKRLVAAYNTMEGVTCNETEGALYTFPQIRLSEKAIAAAEKAGKAPDAFYCLAMLDATGIVTVPGSGFGQAPGTFHYRATILPAEDQIEKVISMTHDFHSKFMDQYRDSE
jgi:alanine transaminase